MLSFTRAHNGVVCCNHPRGANLAEVAILKISKCNVLKLSQHFQLVYFCRFATSSKARHAVIYSVGSLDVLQTYKACRSLRSWASKNVVRTCSSCASLIRFRCLDKYVNIADLGLLSNALALQMAGGLRGRSPPN